MVSTPFPASHIRPITNQVNRNSLSPICPHLSPCPWRRQEDDSVHGRHQHAGARRVRLAAAAGADAAVARLRVLVRPRQAVAKERQGTNILVSTAVHS